MRAVEFQVVGLEVERGQVLGNMRPVGEGEKKNWGRVTGSQ